MCKGFQQDAEALQKDMAAALSLVSEIKEQDKAVVQPTLTVVGNKLQALNIVMSQEAGAKAALDKHIDGYQVDPLAALKQGSMSPPIEKFMNLVTIEKGEIATRTLKMETRYMMTTDFL